jgi:hypothetical protein
MAHPSRSGSPSGAQNRSCSEQPGQSQSQRTHPSPRSAAVIAASVQSRASCTAPRSRAPRGAPRSGAEGCATRDPAGSRIEDGFGRLEVCAGHERDSAQHGQGPPSRASGNPCTVSWARRESSETPARLCALSSNVCRDPRAPRRRRLEDRRQQGRPLVARRSRTSSLQRPQAATLPIRVERRVRAEGLRSGAGAADRDRRSRLAPWSARQ